MAKKNISLEDATTVVEVDLFGTTFRALRPTRSVLAAAGEIEKQMQESEDDDNDRAMDLIGQMLDARLAPVGNGKKLPSAIIAQKWESDELDLPQIQRFVEDLTEAQFARPT